MHIRWWWSFFGGSFLRRCFLLIVRICDTKVGQYKSIQTAIQQGVCIPTITLFFDLPAGTFFFVYNHSQISSAQFLFFYHNPPQFTPFQKAHTVVAPSFAEVVLDLSCELPPLGVKKLRMSAGIIPSVLTRPSKFLNFEYEMCHHFACRQRRNATCMTTGKCRVKCISWRDSSRGVAVDVDDETRYHAVKCFMLNIQK